MISYDENGNPVSAQKLSDVTEELVKIEMKLKGDVTKLSDEEKLQFVRELNALKSISALVTPELQKSASPIELMGFLKQMLKIKNTAEKFKEKNIDI